MNVCKRCRSSHPTIVTNVTITWHDLTWRDVIWTHSNVATLSFVVNQIGNFYNSGKWNKPLYWCNLEYIAPIHVCPLSVSHCHVVRVTLSVSRCPLSRPRSTLSRCPQHVLLKYVWDLRGLKKIFLFFSVFFSWEKLN